MNALGYMTHTVRFDEVLIGDQVRIPVGNPCIYRNVLVHRITERPDGSIRMSVRQGNYFHHTTFKPHEVQRGIALVIGA